MNRRLAMGLALLAASCAGRTLTPGQTVRLAEADGRAARGCYRCLRDALAGYDALLAGHPRPASLAPRVFVTTLLLALREKELGLEAASFLDRAAAAAPSLPLASGAATYLDIARALPWEPAALAKEDVPDAAAFNASRDALPAWRAFLAAGPLGDPLNGYLSTALTCAFDYEGRQALAESEASSLSPILRYRLGACELRNAAPVLESLLEAEPEFTEAGFFLGRRALGETSSSAMRRARERLAAARDAFPDSPAVAMTLAGVHRAFGDCRAADRLYEEVLAREPRHREALLGRAVCLSRTVRHEEAIVHSDRLIALGTYYIGEAFYWRAWNQYALSRLPEARDSVAEARKRLVSSEVLTLSGLVEYGLQERLRARTDFTEAKQLDADNCRAGWYLGLIASDLGEWEPSAVAFADAMKCYERADAALRAELERTRASDAPEEVKAAQIAEQEQGIEENTRQILRAAFNAGYGYVRADRPSDADAFLDRAAADEDLRPRVERLRPRP